MGADRHAVAATQAEILTIRNEFRVVARTLKTDDPHRTVGGAQAILFAFVFING
jgi:hypothetical protein